jgi:hypothetical protein
VILFPSLGLLFELVLRGRFSAAPSAGRGARAATPAIGLTARIPAKRFAGACFAVGAAFLAIGESAWPHAIGVALLGASIVLGLSALAGEDARE